MVSSLTVSVVRPLTHPRAVEIFYARRYRRRTPRHPLLSLASVRHRCFHSRPSTVRRCDSVAANRFWRFVHIRPSVDAAVAARYTPAIDIRPEVQLIVRDILHHRVSTSSGRLGSRSVSTSKYLRPKTVFGMRAEAKAWNELPSKCSVDGYCPEAASNFTV